MHAYVRSYFGQEREWLPYWISFIIIILLLFLKILCSYHQLKDSVHESYLSIPLNKKKQKTN